jgi:multicomponent Na+:H+ antiporter subunit A
MRDDERGRRRVRRGRATDVLAWAAVGLAGAGLACALAVTLSGGGSVDWEWAPTLGLRLDLALDGLGSLYALLATGIGVAVFAYAIAYMPWHLDHEGRPRAEAARFWAWMAIFMGSMVGLACARDLILIFFFFDLTAVASYFLIAFDRERREARGAALMALFVTGVSAVLLLLGAVLLYDAHGTFELRELFALAEPGTTTTIAAALIAIAAFAKSAQAPLHFWLPRAMEAPTPVSAYLHSAAMVAAGVLVLGRVHPLLTRSELVMDGMLVVGLASILIGSVLAFAKDELKQILAHSTISQYGYVVVLYGIGGPEGAGAAALYVVAHALAKSALFMTAGAVTVATGESRLSRVGGLARRMPLLAAASALAAASLAALPLTIGFFKDELFFGAAIEKGPLMQAAAVLAASFTLAYIARFWLGIFAGPARAEAARVPALLVAPIAALGAVSLAGGVVIGPFAELAANAATVTNGAPVELHPAYHLDTRAENLMALGAWALGALLLFGRPLVGAAARAFARAGDRLGPRAIYRTGVIALNRFSDRVHDEEVRDLRNSIAAVLVPAGILVAAAFIFTPTDGVYRVGSVSADDLPIIGLLAVAALAAIQITRDPGRLRPVMALSVLGFALAAAYAVSGAPDVALVAVVVETVLTVVFVGVYARLPRAQRQARERGRRQGPGRNAIAGGFAGLAAFVVIWAALSRQPVAEGDAARQAEAAPAAHGGDIVTVTLADFRGLDTMVEITVLAVALLGVATLLRRGRLW